MNRRCNSDDGFCRKGCAGNAPCATIKPNTETAGEPKRHITVERLEELKMSPRQADVSDVEDLCDEVEYLQSRIDALAFKVLGDQRIAITSNGPVDCSTAAQTEPFDEVKKFIDQYECGGCGGGIPDCDTVGLYEFLKSHNNAEGEPGHDTLSCHAAQGEVAVLRAQVAEMKRILATLVDLVKDLGDQ